MTLQEILDAIDQLSTDEVDQIKAHLGENPASGSEAKSNDLERMSGIFEADVSDLSINAREYLRDIFQNKHERSGCHQLSRWFAADK